MMYKGAGFSEDRVYRYRLWRTWKAAKGSVCFVGLNPSTADENIDDKTITRCIRFAEAWGYGGIFMVNLFAFMATKPKDMMKSKDPVGPDNDIYIRECSEMSEITIAAWGNLGVYDCRNVFVRSLLRNPHYLKLTNKGNPSHPLYLKKDLKPIEWPTKGAL